MNSPAILTHNRVYKILDDLQNGKESTLEDGIALFESSGDELKDVLEAADQIRTRTNGDTITYVKVKNINFTNICKTGCKFCAFSKSPGNKEAYRFTLEEIASQAEDAYNNGMTEVCLQGGIDPGIDGFFYINILNAIKERVPDIHIHAFSPFEILHGSRTTGIELDEYLEILKSHGLGSVPGTAAEILDDSIRNRLCKNKLSTEEWITIIKSVHRTGIPSTATIMYGHIDSACDWVHHILTIRDIQKETGGFTEFVPLGFVHNNTVLFKSGTARPGPTREESIKLHAIARLLLYPYIRNLQVSWVKLGIPLARYILQNCGANDFGGTLLNENITRAAGGTNGECLPETEIRRHIQEIGRIPAQRDTLYNIVEK